MDWRASSVDRSEKQEGQIVAECLCERGDCGGSAGVALSCGVSLVLDQVHR